MIDIIIRCINKKALEIIEKYNKNNPEKEQRVQKNIIAQELYVFIDVLICVGVNNSNIDHINEINHHQFLGIAQLWEKIISSKFYV